MSKKTFILIVLVLVGFLVSPVPVMAQDEENVFNNSGLPIPRFVSLRSDKVFVRTGPALRYPLKWVYKREGLPVEIIQEFDTWRKIKDFDGSEGWIHQSLLSGKRNAIIKSDLDVFLFKKPESTSKKLAKVEKGNIITLEKCEPAWCKGSVSGFSGWIERNSLWGVYQEEELD